MLAPEAMATSVLSFSLCAGVFLGAGHGQRAGRLEHRARVLEHVLDRRADGVGVDQHHLVDVLLAQAEGFLADVLHRRAVGEQADCSSRTRLPAFSDCGPWHRHRSASTPMILVSGRRRLM
jgi:hypothetical protein